MKAILIMTFGLSLMPTLVALVYVDSAQAIAKANIQVVAMNGGAK